MAETIRMRFKMTWEEIRETISKLTKRNEEVCKQKPSRRRFADEYRESSLKGITTDCVGLSYGKNKDTFNLCLNEITDEVGELRETPPDKFNPNKTRNTEYALGKWSEWLDSLPKKRNFWEDLRLIFVGRN